MYNSNKCILQERGDFTWRVSDCEELVGVQSQGNGLIRTENLCVGSSIPPLATINFY